jgi:predicted nucleotidyltransferase
MHVSDVINSSVRIIRKHIPKTASVVLFGSWAKGNALPTSDVDLGILGDKKIPFEDMTNIKHEIGQISTLRGIDVVDLNNVDERFKMHALRHTKPL